MIYFTADWHIGHKNILKLDPNRPFGEISHHDETIINNYNKIVKKDDTCYILGDLCWNQSYESYKSILSRLNGNKYVILGNHDNKQNLIRCQKEGLIVSVRETQTLQIGDDRIFLSHFPHREWAGYYKGAYHLYGHCVDDYTEILTTKGWKGFKDISKDSKVLNLNLETGVIEEDVVNEIISKNYSGDVYHFTSKGVDLRVTDKHRMVTMTTRKNKFKIMTAEEFAKSGTRYFLSVNKDLLYNIDEIESTKIEHVDNEHFWCVSTNNGTIITRRNGKVVITGNCHGNIDDYKQSTDIGVSVFELEPVSWEEVKQYIDNNCEPNI